MTAKSPDDQTRKSTNDPGASAAPTTLMSWLAKKFPGWFNASHSPEDMNGFFDALEIEKAKKRIGQFIVWKEEGDQNLHFGKVSNVETFYPDPNFLRITYIVLQHIISGDRLVATGGIIGVKKNAVKFDTFKNEESLISHLVRIGVMPKKKTEEEREMSARFEKHKASERMKAIRATAESILVQLSYQEIYDYNKTSVPDLSDRLVREAYKKAEQIHAGLDRIEKIQAVIDDAPMNVKPTIPRPVGENDVVMELPKLGPNEVFLSTPGGIAKGEK